MVACGLSISEMKALFYRSVEVFMANRDQASFDSVYQVGELGGRMRMQGAWCAVLHVGFLADIQPLFQVMLSLSDEQVDQVLKTLQPETRKAIAMWNKDSADKPGVSSMRMPSFTSLRRSGPPEPEPKVHSGPPEPAPRRLSGPPPPDTVPRPPQLSREAQQGERIERYTSGGPIRPGLGQRMWVDVGSKPTGPWQGFSNAGMQPPLLARTAPRPTSVRVSTSKGRVVQERRREVPHAEAIERGYISKDAPAAKAATVAPQQDPAEPTKAPDPAAGSRARAAPPAGAPPAKLEGKAQVYGPEQQRADVMEARKRAYELTSAIAAERTDNARLREELREEKAKARDGARTHKKLADKLQRQARSGVRGLGVGVRVQGARVRGSGFGCRNWGLEVADSGQGAG